MATYWDAKERKRNLEPKQLQKLWPGRRLVMIADHAAIRRNQSEAPAYIGMASVDMTMGMAEIEKGVKTWQKDLLQELLFVLNSREKLHTPLPPPISARRPFQR